MIVENEYCIHYLIGVLGRCSTSDFASLLFSISYAYEERILFGFFTFDSFYLQKVLCFPYTGIFFLFLFAYSFDILNSKYLYVYMEGTFLAIIV